MFSTVDDRLFFVDPPVAAKIHALRLRQGEAIVIVKRSYKDGRKVGVRWEVERAQSIQPEQKPVVATPAPASVPAITETQSPLTPNILTRQLAGALIASIDALVLARQYAEKKGIKAEIVLDFNAEDARTLANAAMIQMQREIENALKYRTHTNGASNGTGYVNGHVNGNGGAQWPRQ
jgi:hypothetical protein